MSYNYRCNLLLSGLCAGQFFYPIHRNPRFRGRKGRNQVSVHKKAAFGGQNLNEWKE